MNKSRPADPNPQRAARQEREERAAPAQDDAAGNELQPPATGANRGSPAAPVMKQFQKTRTESSGRS